MGKFTILNQKMENLDWDKLTLEQVKWKKTCNEN